MTATDYIEWVWTALSIGGVVLLGFIMRFLVDYWRSSRTPSALNGRRGMFATVLLRLAGFCLFVQGLLGVSGIAALLRPNSEVERITEGVVALVVAGLIDIVWALTLADLVAIENYAPPTEGATH